MPGRRHHPHLEPADLLLRKERDDFADFWEGVLPAQQLWQQRRRLRRERQPGMREQRCILLGNVQGHVEAVRDDLRIAHMIDVAVRADDRDGLQAERLDLTENRVATENPRVDDHAVRRRARLNQITICLPR